MKKFLAALLVFVMVFAICACSGTTTTPTTEQPATTGEQPTAQPTAQPTGEQPADKPLAGTYDIKVWCAENAKDLFDAQIKKYNETNTDGIVINATIQPVSEADAGTNMLTDVEAGGDIYCFAQDQFARLVQGAALAKLGEAAQAIVKEANDAGVVGAATLGDAMYAYPMTSDNGYFMYYDKSVIPEEDLDSLEKLIEDCEKANKYFSMETNSSAWYLAGFFFGVGCHSDWKVGEDGKSFVDVDDDFNSDKGLIAAKGIKKLVDSKANLSSSKAEEFSNGAAIVVTGTWAFNDIKNILGDNLGATDLPSFTVDGKQYHIGSFNGCKLLGVKPQKDAKRQAALHKLAQYLTDYDCQMERFDKLAWGPANKQAQASDAVKANPGLAALFAQNQYSVPQGQIHGSWWDIAKVIADDVKAATDEAGLKTAIENYDAKIKALFSMSEDEKNAWTVIGEVKGTSWNEDFPMTEDPAGTWKSNEAFEFAAGAQFKVRQGKSWDVSVGNGGDNFVVETAGTYYVQFVVEGDSGTITLIPA